MKRTRECPDCGGRLVRIVYSLPGSELQDEARQGDVARGGCQVTDDDPGWKCTECDSAFGMDTFRPSRSGASGEGHS